MAVVPAFLDRGAPIPVLGHIWARPVVAVAVRHMVGCSVVSDAMHVDGLVCPVHAPCVSPWHLWPGSPAWAQPVPPPLEVARRLEVEPPLRLAPAEAEPRPWDRCVSRW